VAYLLLIYMYQSWGLSSYRAI